jgi:hypothetical protein
MKAWIAAAALALPLSLAGALGHDRAVAASIEAAVQGPSGSDAHDRAARHRDRRDRTYRPYYLGRPTYYSPGPLFPYLPFVPAWPDNPLGW